jgi:hypothetical protein
MNNRATTTGTTTDEKRVTAERVRKSKKNQEIYKGKQKLEKKLREQQRKRNNRKNE